MHWVLVYTIQWSWPSEVSMSSVFLNAVISYFNRIKTHHNFQSVNVTTQKIQSCQSTCLNLCKGPLSRDSLITVMNDQDILQLHSLYDRLNWCMTPFWLLTILWSLIFLTQACIYFRLRIQTVILGKSTPTYCCVKVYWILYFANVAGVLSSGDPGVSRSFTLPGRWEIEAESSGASTLSGKRMAARGALLGPTTTAALWRAMRCARRRKDALEVSQWPQEVWRGLCSRTGARMNCVGISHAFFYTLWVVFMYFIDCVQEQVREWIVLASHMLSCILSELCSCIS